MSAMSGCGSFLRLYCMCVGLVEIVEIVETSKRSEENKKKTRNIDAMVLLYL